ncbi:MAG: hypothetical protein MRJ65_11955 [Candidatus Brocadiaceae bacterium]|nr:hypothetical protein [Candidatus Brocadiaceae bacterium]
MKEKNGKTYTTKDATMLLRDRSPATVDLDNLMRRVLRVSDPTNSMQVADALGKLYEAENEAMAREASGLPYRLVPTLKTQPMATTSTGSELEQAKDDVERDLEALMNNAILKDIWSELRGWATAIRTAIAEGVNAARFSLDPRQRDKTFAIRRLLGNYARIARYVGALTPTLNQSYRKLAQSLDEVSGVLLVIMGETIANIGMGGGRFLLQAPVSELQERRDAVIYALRNLVGSTQEAYGPNDWPRGLQAYSQFMERLGKNAHHDLRVLFQENEIARLMDELIHHATGNTSDGLRALGATAQLTLERFRRLIMFGQGIISPESPPLAAFLTSLKLFLDAFDNADSGYRLLTVSRPPVLFYGLYGIGGQDPASRRLLDLIIQRGKLAEELDCYLGCNCGSDEAMCQIILDKILYDVDRAIDLYALGNEDFGEPEQRAAAYGYVIEAVLSTISGIGCRPDIKKEEHGSGCEQSKEEDSLGCKEDRKTLIKKCSSRFDEKFCRPKCLFCVPEGSRLERILEDIKENLWDHEFEAIDFAGVDSGCLNTGFPIKFGGVLRTELKLFETCIDAIPGGTSAKYEGVYGCIKKSLIASGIIADCSEDIPSEKIPKSIKRLENMLKIIHQELCFQSEAEGNWRSLLQTMAPSCIKFNGNILSPTIEIINCAIHKFAGEIETCPPFAVTIPPHYETSLDSIVDDIDRTGLGRT